MIHNPLTTYKTSPNHLYSTIGKDAMILDLNSGVYYGLNDTGNQIWHWLKTPKTLMELNKLLLNEYNVSLEVAIADLQTILQQMLDKGLIEIVTQEAPHQASSVTQVQ